MGVERVVTIVCDYAECLNCKKGPAVIQWNETRVGEGKEESPEAAKYLVFSSHNGTAKTFCCQLCAASYFLPPGWNLAQNKVQTLPVAVAGQKPVQTENSLAPEAACECGHPLEMHNHWGCTWVMSNKPGDYCKCEKQGEDPT